MLPQSVIDFRDHYRIHEIPRHYSGLIHAGSTSGLCLMFIALCIIAVSDPVWWEFLAIPVTFLYANFVEYRAHRGPMHRRPRFFPLIYERHTLNHHFFFTQEAMGLRDLRDFKAVLFPWFLIVFFISLFAVPVGILLYLLITPNTAFLFMATAVGYFLNYEWLHLAYHLPENSRFDYLPGLGLLKRHHQTHHNQELMNTYNFNITYPISDWMFRTTFRDSRTQP